MNKFIYYNDTKKNVSIHPSTESSGTACDMSVIKPFEQREFILPKGTYPWVKQWEDGKILVSPLKDLEYKDETVHMGKYPIEFSFTDERTGENIIDFCDEIMEKSNTDLEIYSMLSLIRRQVYEHLDTDK